MTADDLLRMPADHLRHELINGELTTMAPEGFEHGASIMNLGAPLAHHVKANDLGVVLGAETGFVIARSPDTVRAPDVAFVAKDRIPPGKLTPKFWPGAPDLAVEVVSPDDTVYEVDEKVKMWLDAGCRLVWVVNPKRRTVTVSPVGRPPHILVESDTLDGADVVTGFTLIVREIFP
jgi:Uma2 family endonuclease